MTLRTRKHAGTSSVSVLLDAVKGGVRLRVRDDGRGFNLSGSAEAPGQVGLAEMRERAELAKGRLTIQTAPGHGTTAQAWVPLAPRNQSRLP
jgi:signal transduction histidine kinase